jgi:hypothetical protein
MTWVYIRCILFSVFTCVFLLIRLEYFVATVRFCVVITDGCVLSCWTVLLTSLTLPYTSFSIHYSVQFNHSILSMMQLLTASLNELQSNTNKVPDLTDRGSYDAMPDRCRRTPQGVVISELGAMVEWWLTGERMNRREPYPVTLSLPCVSHDVTGTEKQWETST